MDQEFSHYICEKNHLRLFYAPHHYGDSSNFLLVMFSYDSESDSESDMNNSTNTNNYSEQDVNNPVVDGHTHPYKTHFAAYCIGFVVAPLVLWLFALYTLSYKLYNVNVVDITDNLFYIDKKNDSLQMFKKYLND